MTVKELKSQIRDLIDTLPEENLEEIYNFLKDFNKISKSTIKQTYNLSKILLEDRDLLKKLAK
jgi:uncharacterized protein YerC